MPFGRACSIFPKSHLKRFWILNQQMYYPLSTTPWDALGGGHGQLTLLPINTVELDRTNPRIRRFLEIHQDEPTYDQIALALDVAGSDGADSQGATTPEKLRNSILTNGGIMQPIIVNEQPDGRLICVEGNTRLYIYRSFVTEKIDGDWTKIPALVHEGLEAQDVDAIRLQAHLVGPRQWDAYSKAKYLWELQYKELMPIDRIIAFCGGNKRDVTTAIQAYADMEHYYRPICVADDYDTEKYSWPAPGSEDTELRCLMEQEVRHGEKAVYAGVQA
jgi:hypothetical protein